MDKKYYEKIYSGVLGKIIGVYLGRPVEGWSYEKIQNTFGDVPYYVHKECDVPLIVADDDISGTFGFFNALRDFEYKKTITSEDIGNTWLNYIIEDKTILWWGGLGRSTEHTAFLHLKNGIPAPQSGSIAQNGQTLAEQIGAQIFIDAFTMACPNDPDLAVDFVRKAASVSHDGLALDAACLLAAMEAKAFEETNLDVLLDTGLKYVKNDLLLRIIDDVRSICSKEKDWRKVRAYLNPKYGYEVYPGCCHMVPNHAMVIASLLLGEDNFQESIKIAASAAWDTDCNAGNVGAVNGIRLGLEGINSGADFRTPVSDRMLVITSNGGECVSDAVIESKKIIQAACALNGDTCNINSKRFSFDFPGSVQGFEKCSHVAQNNNSLVKVANANEKGLENGLLLSCDSLADGTVAAVSTPTFLDFNEIAKNFSTIASPTLYETQTVEYIIAATDKKTLVAEPYILYYDIENTIIHVVGEKTLLGQTDTVVTWKIPSTGGMPIFRLGLSFTSKERFTGDIIVKSVDWKQAPVLFKQEGMLMTSIWNTNPYWTMTWASSAKNFAADFKYTYCVSHPEENGLVTMGTEQWENYTVSSSLCFALHKSGGLVARSRGHRRYYACLLKDFNTVQIIKRKDNEITILAEAEFSYAEDALYPVDFTVCKDELSVVVNEKELLRVNDSSYTCGGAGYIINSGTMTASGFQVKGL